jgi:hypothetical protein
MFLAFVYIADRIATISFNVGSWLIYNTVNGIHYVFNRARGEYVSITKDEYDRLLKNQKST